MGSKSNKERRIELLEEKKALLQQEYDALSTPKKKKRTLSSTAKRFLDEYGRISMRGLSTYAFGVPQLVMHKINPGLSNQIFKYPDSALGQVSDTANQIAALTQGGAAKLATGVGRSAMNIFGKKFLGKLAAGAAGGSAFGLSQIADPRADFETFIKKQEEQAVAGAVSGAIVNPALQGARKIAKGLKITSNDKNFAKFLQKTRRAFYRVKSRAVAKFGDQLDDLVVKNPDKKVDLYGVLDDYINNPNDIDPSVRRHLNRIPKLKKMMVDPKASTEVTVKEAQDIINFIQNKIPKNIKSKHLELLDLTNDLKAIQLDAFPEMAAFRAEYAQTIEPFNQVKNQFKFNTLETAIKNNFRGAEGREAIKLLLHPKKIEQLGGVHAAQKTMSSMGELFRNLTIGISSALGAGFAFRKLQGE